MPRSTCCCRKALATARNNRIAVARGRHRRVESADADACAPQPHGGTLALVAPPRLLHAPAWQAAGIDLGVLQVIEASPRDALWAFEQCLRSGARAAVIGWPRQADAQALRRLQVAADSGDCLGFVLRERRHAANPSPAALRLEHDGDGWRIRNAAAACSHARVPAPGPH